MIADVVVGLQYGDEGKGKVSYQLAKNGNYTHVLRYNGGCNAGHTFYHDNKKFVTHHIPVGVFFGIKSVIGSGCVIAVNKLMTEIDELEKEGIKVKENLAIASNAHIITDFHKSQDKKDTKIGTTKTGNGPAYRDKYDRKGVLAIEVPELEDYIIDLYAEFHEPCEDSPEPEILCEGAQGFGLDIDWGDYPYVTSSSCTVSGATSNGIPFTSIRDVWGVAKIYETYVGEKEFELNDPEMEKIREVGKEFGATTGRPRQVSILDMNIIKRAININAANKIVFNKVDILEEVGSWKAIMDGILYTFRNGQGMQNWIEEVVGEDIDFVMFSGDPHKI